MYPPLHPNHNFPWFEIPVLSIRISIYPPYASPRQRKASFITSGIPWALQPEISLVEYAQSNSVLQIAFSCDCSQEDPAVQFFDEDLPRNVSINWLIVPAFRIAFLACLCSVMSLAMKSTCHFSKISFNSFAPPAQESFLPIFLRCHFPIEHIFITIEQCPL